MPQIINASRAVFCVNMNSPAVKKTNSEYFLPRLRRSNNTQLKVVSAPEQPIIPQSNIMPIIPRSDRSMSRRQINQPTIMQRAQSRQPPVPFSPVKELAECMETADIQPLTEEMLTADKKTTAWQTSRLISPLNASPSSDLDAAEIEESYLIDIPVYLLSQKYFGTRY